MAENHNQQAQQSGFNRRVMGILNSLDRWTKRIGNHYVQKRDQLRRQYRSLITVYVPEPGKSVVGEVEDQIAIQAWTREISRSGLSFIYHEAILADKIIICMNPPGRKCLYVDATIVRKRPLQDGFWEFGVRFTGRAAM